MPLVDMVERLPAIQGPRGRPRKRPSALIGDRGYGFPWIIAAIKAKRIRSLLCPRGSEHGSGLGRRRYVVEQTLAAFGQCRRIKMCYEKTELHFQAFHELAASLLCFWRLKQVTGGF